MHYFRKLNENYYIYVILIFALIPINFIPQLFDGVLIHYAFESGNTEILLESMYKNAGRPFHFLFINFIFFLSKLTLLPIEILFDNLVIFFLIVFCMEVKKYSKLFFNLEKKWSNLAALFTALFPVWHILVDFDIGLYLISIYFLLFGFRQFISQKLTQIIIGSIFIILSFNVESNLSFVVGLGITYLILNKLNNTNNFSYLKLIFLILISFGYYFMRELYFPPMGDLTGYQTVTWDKINSNLTIIKIIKNIVNYSTFFLLYLWIPVVFFLHLLFKNNKYSLKKVLHSNYTKNYFLLILLSGFAIFPYLIVDKSSTILSFTDYYQRHAFLLAPIFGMFFSIMFKDMEKINCLQNKINLNFYFIIFIVVNLFLLNCGNYKKVESYLIRDGLIEELKYSGSIPKGNVKFIGKNIPFFFRPFELNYLLYKAYGATAWWSTPFHFHINKVLKPSAYEGGKGKSRKQLTFAIAGEYKDECNIYIYLENDLTKYERLKRFYVLNHRSYYNIDKILKKC